MTPKEKANELVNKYLIITPIVWHIYNAKKCALIAVDEILDVLNVIDNFEMIYWEQVKQEIEKL
jgi:hypothetical protein